MRGDEVEEKKSESGARPLWNIVSVVLPFGAIVLGLLFAASSPGHGGNVGAALGVAFLFVLLVGGASLLGVIAAIVAFARGERKAWLSLIGLVGNCAVVFPIFALLMRD